MCRITGVLPRDGTYLPIGKPIANYRVYILGPYGELLPVGVPGELCIAGDGVTRGYLNRPELTAEKFVNKSFSGGPGGRFFKKAPLAAGGKIYKTGDLARWQPDGNLEFLGRIDSQVKIRGYRIELGEIENRLLKHNEITGAVVISRENEAGDRYLCAYFVGRDSTAPGKALETPGLKEYLSQTLPEYMIPGYFVKLEKIPLNSSGKVDVKALPEPGPGISQKTYAAPRDEIEAKLADIWAEVLNIRGDEANVTIGIDDNFFDLGGHSLKATTLVHRIYQEFEINIEIGDVFTYPTIRELGQRIKGLEASEYIEISPSEEKDYYPLSYAQRRLWVLCQFEEDSTAYNIPAAVVINGAFDAAVFLRAVQALAERHESLRTIFALVDGDPYQEIIPHPDINLEIVDLRSFEEAEKEARARQIFITDANRAFDLEHGPLFRFKPVRLEAEKYLLVYNIHHIISDGWSQGNINDEIITLYNSFLNGRENPLPPLKLHYKDYSRWHNRLIAEGSFNRSQGYWLEKFKDKPNGIELPLDHPRKAIQTFNGGRVFFVIDKAKSRELSRLSRSQDATLFMSLLTLLNIFFYRCSGQADIIIGAPIANRKRPELYPMIGFLVNTLIYRNRLTPGQSFKDLLGAIKQETMSCYEYQDYPFDLLVEALGLDRDLSQSPLFNVMLAHNNADTGDRELTFAGVTVSPYAYSDDFNMSKFDLIFFMAERGGEISTWIEYNSDLFERSTIERMAANFLSLAADAIARSDAPVSTLNILSQAEAMKVIETFNDTHYPFSPLTLQELFEQRVETCRDKVAVVSLEQSPGGGAGAMHITYHELNQSVNRAAHFLVEDCGVKRGDAIAISMDRSIAMIVALLGIIKSGAAYLAVDPTYPRDRVLHVLTNSRSDFLITDRMRRSYSAVMKAGSSISIPNGKPSRENPPPTRRRSINRRMFYISITPPAPPGPQMAQCCPTIA